MPVKTPFRITPSLGPALTQTSPDYYWDDLSPDVTVPSYQPGSKVVGNDGHEYVHVRAGAALALNARVNINETTWDATADAAGTHMAPVAVANGSWFQARKFVL